MPISAVKGKKIDNIKGKKLGVIGIASDIVTYDKKYEQIILNLLGKTLIVDNMQNAITIAKENNYTFKIITIDGDVINPSGAMTGGSVAKKTVNILGRSREIENLEKEIKNLKDKISKIEKEKEEYINSSENIIEGIENLEKQLQEIDITYATEKQRVISIEENIQGIQERIIKLKEESNKNEQNYKENLKDKEEIQKQIEEISKQNEEKQKIIDEFSNSNKESQNYIDDLNLDITNLKISVSSFYESETSIEEMTEIISKEIDTHNKNKDNKKNQIERLKDDNIKLQQEIENIKNKIEEIKSQVEHSGENIGKLKKDRIQKNEKLTKKEEEQTEEFRIIEDLKTQLTKIEIKKTKTEEDITEFINKLWEEYELTPNNVENYQKPENVQLTQRKVNNLRTDIRELGSVNVDSIEEYKNQKQRYDFMCEQRLDLENTMSKLRKVIQEMLDTMKQQFKEKFEIINKNFGEVFKELFGGGMAQVTLTDEENILECGIEITVQPPGKKLQSMTLLSGGERAFTAIALLFAILKINPAPFCVLDEIEAALDDVNVYRYAEYLKKFAKETQFLVITHRKGTMEAADTVYGVTMEEKGISKLLSMKLKS